MIVGGESGRRPRPIHEDLVIWQRENGRGRVTDREMVDLANRLQGWTASVYEFGRGFIHLSR